MLLQSLPGKKYNGAPGSEELEVQYLTCEGKKTVQEERYHCDSGFKSGKTSQVHWYFSNNTSPGSEEKEPP
jgi:hypothetical protein